MTPITNYLSGQLAVLLSDPVGGDDDTVKAHTDGSVFPALTRNRYICSAFRDVVNTLVNTYGIDRSAALLQGLTKSKTFDFGSVPDVPGDFMVPHSLLVGTQEYNYITHHSELIQDLDPWLGAGYTIDGGKVYAYARTNGTWAQLTTGSGQFDYVAAGRVDSLTGLDQPPDVGDDVGIEPKLYNAVLYFAASRACMDKASSPVDPDPKYKLQGDRYHELALEALPKPAEQG